ncbi:RNA-directed DNA polymerase from mobile element jockey-like, partial [Brachionus plicatilis]
MSNKPDLRDQSNCKLFADDTNLIGVIRNPLDLTTLQGDIDCLVRWAEDWMMDFNVDKCSYMIFNNKYFDINLKMNGLDMCKTEKERDLGIMISSNL